MKTQTIFGCRIRVRQALFAFFVLVSQTIPIAFGQQASVKTESPAVPEDCAWSTGAVLPSGVLRAVGVYFPGNGRFYVMGGRATDTAGSDFTHPFEYTPASNTWVTKAATYPDNQVSNMACGVLTDAGTSFIYCVGGSAGGGTGMSAGRVFRYNPVTDAISTVPAPWSGNANGITLPGGFTVFQNKFYILGGFQLATGMTNQIWEFTPGTNVWAQKTAVLPVALGYVPATTVGAFIYTAGGDTFTAPSTLTDTTNAFRYNPVADTITTISNIPRATGETRALGVNGQMWVVGGGRISPNPSTQINIYDPATSTWTTGTAFATARRNFPTDSDGSRIWLGGGYDSAGTGFLSSTELFQCTAIAPTSAVSRKTHGGAGTFDVDLPLSGTPGIECRAGGGTSDYTVVVTYGSAVTVNGNPQAQVIVGTGTVGSGGVSNGGMVTVSGNTVTVPLTNVTNAQTINVRINGVTMGPTNGNTTVPMSVLVGDTSANSAVNSADVSQSKARLGQTLDATNFRSDVNANGAINSADVSQIKSLLGTGLP